jgi:hypothetical protein
MGDEKIVRQRNRFRLLIILPLQESATAFFQFLFRAAEPAPKPPQAGCRQLGDTGLEGGRRGGY